MTMQVGSVQAATRPRASEESENLEIQLMVHVAAQKGRAEIKVVFEAHGASVIPVTRLCGLRLRQVYIQVE